MKKLLFLMAFLPLLACSKNEGKNGDFGDFSYPTLQFQNNAMGTSGGMAIDRLVPDPETFLRDHVLDVARTLYFKADDQNLPTVNSITVIVDPSFTAHPAQKEDLDNNSYIIRLNPGHFEGAALATDQKKMLELEGVMNHELTHIYQAQPRGAGAYDGSSPYWAFIEGTADAVRPLLGPYADGAPAMPGGTWMSGYRTTGWFLVWLTDTKDADFMRKFNRTAVQLNPWSWDSAMENIFGEGVTTQELWDEYQASF